MTMLQAKLQPGHEIDHMQFIFRVTAITASNLILANKHVVVECFPIGIHLNNPANR